MRNMDRRWGLSQMEAGMRNSRVHARQPARARRKMTARGALGLRASLELAREAEESMES